MIDIAIASPFALLVDPAPVEAAARRAELLQLPRHAVYLFGKKGVTNNPAISRLDEDVELETDDEADEA